MKKLKIYLSIFLALSMMLCGTSMFTVNAAQMTETEDVLIDTEANLGGEDELQPMMARACTGVPSMAYAVYNDVKNGYGSWYSGHEYMNKSGALPGGITYMSYYIVVNPQNGDLRRVVIGSDGSAFYTADHYNSWIRMY